MGHRSPEASSRSDAEDLFLPDPYRPLLEVLGTTPTCSSGLFPKNLNPFTNFMDLHASDPLG